MLPLTIADLWLFASCALGLWLVPAALGRYAGGCVAVFAVFGIFLLAGPELPPLLHPARSAAAWFLIAFGPLLALAPDLMARGRIARVIDEVPLRALIAWSLVHVMGLRHVFSALRGDLGAEFALWIASSEFFSALGALFLWVLYRPESRWFRFAALFWNAHALFVTLEFSARLLTAHPGMPFFARPAPDLFAFFSAWPGALEALFWTPFLLCLHAALFYKLLRPRPPVAAGGFTPGPTS